MTPAQRAFRTPVDFASIDAVLAHRFVGNHAADHQAFEGIRRFVLRDDVTDADRLQALNHEFVAGMGLDPITLEQLPE